jgi:Uma2 family endonuclease
MAASIRSAARTTAPPEATVSRPQRLFTVEEYHRMGEAGVLTENDRCELIRGFIVEKPVINPPHKKAVRRLTPRLAAAFGDDYVIDSQAPITLADSEPEPDFAVAIGPEDRYENRNPRPGEIVLVVEVSDSSLTYDRGDKLELYARGKVPVYWIVNLIDRQIEVYTLPRGGKNPAYRSRTDYAPGQSVPVAVAGEQLGSIPVSEILP